MMVITVVAWLRPTLAHIMASEPTLQLSCRVHDHLEDGVHQVLWKAIPAVFEYTARPPAACFRGCVCACFFLALLRHTSTDWRSLFFLPPRRRRVERRDLTDHSASQRGPDYTKGLHTGSGEIKTNLLGQLSNIFLTSVSTLHCPNMSL